MGRTLILKIDNVDSMLAHSLSALRSSWLNHVSTSSRYIEQNVRHFEKMHAFVIDPSGCALFHTYYFNLYKNLHIQNDKNKYKTHVIRIVMVIN